MNLNTSIGLLPSRNEFTWIDASHCYNRYNYTAVWVLLLKHLKLLSDITRACPLKKKTVLNRRHNTKIATVREKSENKNINNIVAKLKEEEKQSKKKKKRRGEKTEKGILRLLGSTLHSARMSPPLTEKGN